MQITDVHIHVQPWWELKPEIFDAMTRGRSDLDELHRIMKSPSHLLRRLDADGIARAVLVNYPSPENMGFTHDANEYVARYCAEAPDRLIAMGGVHPRFAEDAGAEVRRAVAMGVRALKVHPPQAQRLRVPVMIHTGTSIFPGARSRLGEPMTVDDVAVDFPDLRIILAHGGRPLWMDQAFFLVRRFPNVFMDVSSIPPKAVLRYFPRLAEVADKVLYGSDWPSPGVRSMADNARDFQALPLPADALVKMLETNARALFP